MRRGFDAVLIEDTTLTAPDGYVLAATVFTPMSTPRRAVLINSSTAGPPYRFSEKIVLKQK